VQDADPDALSRIGEVLLVVGGGVDVLWADGSRSTAQPAQLFVVSGDDDMGGPVGTSSMTAVSSSTAGVRLLLPETNMFDAVKCRAAATLEGSVQCASRCQLGAAFTLCLLELELSL
jgi:hypothetical protein